MAFVTGAVSFAICSQLVINLELFDCLSCEVGILGNMRNQHGHVLAAVRNNLCGASYIYIYNLCGAS